MRSVLWLIMLFIIVGCGQKSYAVEYEFLTPCVVVVKGDTPNPSGVISTSYRPPWQKENGLIRNGKGEILRKADVTYYQYFVLNKPCIAGKKEYIGSVPVQYDPDKPSNIFKLNQVGNGANQKKKFAYIGAWLGRMGALPLKHFDGKEFELRRSNDGKCVFKNRLKYRGDDPRYQGKTAFTGEEVLELDYSSFNVPGKYYFYVENIGRSMDFVISSEAVNEAFYIHARGLYHKRCGIAKTQPFTAWTSPACHNRVYQGKFPENDADYRMAKGKRSYGFFDRKGNPVEVKHFELIRDNPAGGNVVYSVSGGWHDAADYDRRPYHLRIVSDLAMVYLMKPENFIDGQLNIPESGNGIPDILDEAAWGLKHLLSVQQSDGGVGTWFETTGHPGPGEGLPDREKRNYYVSAPTRNGTLEYAAAAATLALALKKANAAEADRYLVSAIKAWEFASDRKNQLVSWYIFKDKMVNYVENHQLYAENLVKAGIALYVLTGDEKYLTPIVEAESRIIASFNKDFWKWSPLTWMSLELFPVKALAKINSEYRKVILRDADNMLADQENSYPYRTLWHAPAAGWVHTMAWGSYHPLRRAVTLIAAHRITGAEKYLNGAYLANDFQNGANPLGRSMTSGLGKIYPAAFLDLVSYADGIGEFVPGITPYGNTFGVDRNAVKMVYGKDADKLPIFRRYVNLEFLSVPSSEYSVWETIAPAAVTTGYLIEKPALPSTELKNRKPAPDFRKLPGYKALP